MSLNELYHYITRKINFRVMQMVFYIIYGFLYEINMILYQLQRLKIQEKYYREANRS